MIFYTIKHNTQVVGWAGTQAEAKQLTKEATAAWGLAGACTWQEEEVPTDKPSLLAWLKVNALGGEEEEF